MPEDEDSLSIAIERFAGSVLPQEVDVKARADLLQILRDAATAAFAPHRADVHVFGSVSNGCGERSADIDAVVELSSKVMKDVCEGSTQKALQKLRPHCTKRDMRFVTWALGARVPILTLEAKTVRNSGGAPLHCDISFNNLLPLYNTQLFKAYADLDQRFTQLVVTIKRWAKCRHVCGAKEGNLSSYSFTLLVLFFLQRMQLLPCLHQLPHEEKSHAEGKKTYQVGFCTAEEALPHMKSRRNHSLGSLLRGFFDFYSDRTSKGFAPFAWGKEVVSVRVGRRGYKDEDEFARLRFEPPRNFDNMSELIHIEDPFDVERNLNCVLVQERHRELRAQLKLAAKEMEGGADLPRLLARLCEECGNTSQGNSGDGRADPANGRWYCTACWKEFENRRWNGRQKLPAYTAIQEATQRSPLLEAQMAAALPTTLKLTSPPYAPSREAAKSMDSQDEGVVLPAAAAFADPAILVAQPSEGRKKMGANKIPKDWHERMAARNGHSPYPAYRLGPGVKADDSLLDRSLRDPLSAAPRKDSAANGWQ
eukprot:TRINITY_DN4572_c0_g1_i1.p1 TRINITY_DN4572_c0_g1~~TRINITY_DN4572_c0_g1_i1.p1  ORF type:complete len:537 (-),score=139.07 TRINITY_DN4572_c0_g1_i1:376-1986(-)